MARTALVSTALRHLRDATHLADEGEHQSLDQALHLVGFAPECVRKACIDERLIDRALGHDIRHAADPIVDFLLAYDPEASRYGVERDEGALPLRAEHWRADLRYERTGNARKGIVLGVVDEARRFTLERVVALWCDGVIDEDALR